jgi:hypothetical protein
MQSRASIEALAAIRNSKLKRFSVGTRLSSIMTSISDGPTGLEEIESP